MSSALNYLGIARKAGDIELGEENTGAAVRLGKARLVILASDASDNARRRAEGFAAQSTAPVVEVPFEKNEIAAAVGKNGCSMAAFTDLGLALSFVRALAAENAEKYGEISERLALKLKRQRERSQSASRKSGKRRNNV